MGVLEKHRAEGSECSPEALVFCTSKGTPLNSKNLYNRELAPACDQIKQPRVSWHSFTRTRRFSAKWVGRSEDSASIVRAFGPGDHAEHVHTRRP
jgi:hypothetical protein